MSEMVAITAEEQKLAEELADELPPALPVLPLKDTVVFPASMTPLAIGQDRSVLLVDDVLAGDRLLALVSVENGDAETPGWNDVYRVGTAALVHKMIRVPDGTLRILVGGLHRIRIKEHVSDDPYLVAELEAGRPVVEQGQAARGTVGQRWVRQEFATAPRSRTT